MDPDAIADGLLAATLPQPEWTHAGHVAAAHALVRRLGPAGALTAFRASVPRLNDFHGVENSDTGGYHDTLTVFYVAAVADCVAHGLDPAETAAALPTSAPLAYWTRETLFSLPARRGFVGPDVAWPAFPLLP